jgi:kynurenine formamidase
MRIENIDIEPDRSIDISIPMSFNGPQPNAYGVAPAMSKAVAAGELVGDTRQGGSVNFEQYTLIPHCNGTHTECVGHITHERISVRSCLQDVIMPAVLVSVEPELCEDSSDLSIDAASLEAAVRSIPGALANAALIVRTLPNDNSKLTAEYGEENIPPYFTAAAMKFIVESGFRHLLTDLPSIDRIYDEGKLSNHRIFWNVKEGSYELNPAVRMNSTITEMIYVPNEVKDGDYLLNLQIAPFDSDCAPSRPILIRRNT